MSSNGFAHGDLHERIDALTEKIKANPRENILYWQRGELHRLHSDWKLALEDYDRFAASGTNFPLINLARGKALFVGGEYAKAKTALDQFLGKFPQHGEGLISRARVFSKLGEHLAAVRDYTAALPVHRDLQPEFYIERAQELMAAGSDHLEEALAGLDEGMKRIGFGITLQLTAIDLEVEAKHYDRALARLDSLTATMPRKESWLLRRAEILEKAGRFEEARQAVANAFTAMETLPATRRYVRAMDELEEKLKVTLVRIQKSLNMNQTKL